MQHQVSILIQQADHAFFETPFWMQQSHGHNHMTPAVNAKAFSIKLASCGKNDLCLRSITIGNFLDPPNPQKGDRGRLPEVVYRLANGLEISWKVDIMIQPASMAQVSHGSNTIYR